jgi:RNA-directed DNA polymerase
VPDVRLTSRHSANFYLGWLDRFVIETLRARGYVPYMDDIVLWGDSRQTLVEHHLRSEGFLGEELGLCFKPAQAVASVHGLDFLGCRIFPTHVVLNRRSRRRFRRRVRALLQGMRRGVFCERDVQRRLDALVAFSKSGDTRSWQFRQAVVNSLVVGDP